VLSLLHSTAETSPPFQEVHPRGCTHQPCIVSIIGNDAWRPADLADRIDCAPTPGKVADCSTSRKAFARVVISAAAATCTVNVHDPAAESTIDYGDDSDIGDVFMDFDYSDIAADAAQGGGKSYADLQEALYDIVDSGVTPEIAVTKLNSRGEAVLKS
jgi:hypothetical protein